MSTDFSNQNERMYARAHVLGRKGVLNPFRVALVQTLHHVGALFWRRCAPKAPPTDVMDPPETYVKGAVCAVGAKTNVVCSHVEDTWIGEPVGF